MLAADRCGGINKWEESEHLLSFVLIVAVLWWSAVLDSGRDYYDRSLTGC